MSTPRGPGFRRIRLPQQVRLSLSQRERIKVRDSFWHVSPARSRSPLGRCRVLRELGGSRTGEPEFAGKQEAPHVRDLVFGQFDSYVRHRPAQSPTLPLGSRNRGHKNQPDAAAGICSPQNYGSGGGAKEDVPTWSDAFSNIERGSRRHLRLGQFFGKVELTPHLSPLPLSKGKGGKSFGSRESRTPFVRRRHAIRNVSLR